MMNEKRSVIVWCAVILFLFQLSSVANSSDVLNNVELELQWELDLPGHPCTIASSPNLALFIAESNNEKGSNSIVLVNNMGKISNTLEISKYGTCSDKLSIYDHPAFLQAKSRGKLDQLSLEVNDVIQYSPDCKYLGIIRSYFDNAKDCFNRKFLIFKINPAGEMLELRVKDPICPEVLNELSGQQVKEPWSLCVDSCQIANNGNSMLWVSKGNQSNRVVIWDIEGKTLFEGTCSPSHYPCFDTFEMNDSGDFALSWDSGDFGKEGHVANYYDRNGSEIEKSNYIKGSQPIDITKLSFWSSSLTDNILSRCFFEDENGLNVAYIKAEHTRGQSVTLFNVAKSDNIWTFRNDKEGYEFGKLRTSANGDLILITRVKSWNQNAESFEDYQIQLENSPVEWIFLNKKGEAFKTLGIMGSLEMSLDGTKLLNIVGDRTLKLYSLRTID
ncbi:hypothetical protein JW823_00005 [bacterium]|nr:hypothetical protein [candidate division CSSED10-310 bacterium]